MINPGPSHPPHGAPVRIGARKSDLARLQAVHVATLLQKRWPGLEVELHFSESLGDKNLDNPLWKMPEKGVFTSDLSQALSEGRFDLVVHSWKDLPIESDSRVLGSPPREDPRDLILFRRDAISQWQQTGEKPARLVVLSSSPRRACNLEPFLKTYLPHAPSEVRFEPVRGNIPTRIQKLLRGESGAHALVVARAAVDRLLNPPSDEFAEVARQLREWLALCEWVVAPLSLNPPAPAQGALAIEAAADTSERGDAIRRWVEPILCADTTEAVRLERAELARHGGGCHQKIGSSFEKTAWGMVHTLRGETTDGIRLHARELLERGTKSPQRPNPGPHWSAQLAGVTLFDRQPLASAIDQVLSVQDGCFYVSHPDALPESVRPGDFRRGAPALWCSGLMTWRNLAGRGFWVRGCDDALGERLPEGFTKLGHADSPELGAGIATYRLVPRPVADPHSEWGIAGKKSFFWRSISQFERVVGQCPEILTLKGMHHACGPGATARHLSAKLGDPMSLTVCLDESDWRRRSGIEKDD
jgi:hydroxymethylbilane synthase